MSRVILSLCLLILSVPAEAQVPSYEIEIGEIPKMEDDKRWVQSEEYQTKDKVFAVAGRMEKGGVSSHSELLVLERGKGTSVQRIPLEPKAAGSYADLLAFNGRIFVITSEFDLKAGYYDLYATGFDLADLRPEGTRKRIVHLTFERVKGGALGFSLTESNIRYHSSFVPSADGMHMAFVFDGIRSSEKQQMVVVDLLNDDLDPLWEQVGLIDFDSDAIWKEDVLTGNDGAVHLLMKTRFRDRLFFSREVDYTYELFRIDEQGMTSQPIELPSKRLVATARIHEDGEGIVAGGFYVDPALAPKKIAGAFVCSLPKHGAMTGEYIISPFSEASEMQDWRTSDLLRSMDGTWYLVGTSHTNEQSGDEIEGSIMTASFGPNLSVRWSRTIARRVGNGYKTGIRVKAIMVGDRPLVIFTDDPDNIEVYRAGKEGRSRAGKRVTVLAAFEENGKPVFGTLVPKEKDFIISPIGIGDDLGGGAFAASMRDASEFHGEERTIYLQFTP